MESIRGLWFLFGLLILRRNIVAGDVYVNLTNKGLTSVPTNISANVTDLDISLNEITGIKQEDFNCKYQSLDKVNFTKNSIATVEKGCFKESKLRSIVLSENRLCYFPDFCEVNKTLDSIDLSSNRIIKIKPGDVGCLTVLSFLYLNSNPLGFLPDLQTLLPSLIFMDTMLIPFNCCRSMAWMKNADSVNIDTNPCQAPSSLFGINWTAITRTQLEETPCGKKISYKH